MYTVDIRLYGILPSCAYQVATTLGSEQRSIHRLKVTPQEVQQAAQALVTKDVIGL